MPRVSFGSSILTIGVAASALVPATAGGDPLLRLLAARRDGDLLEGCDAISTEPVHTGPEGR
jgi:hypothetical protein